MTLLELHARLAESNRPQLAMRMILALVDHTDTKQCNEWLSRPEIAEMTVLRAVCWLAMKKNVSKVGQELQKLNLITVRYRDQDGVWHDKSKKGVTTLYQVSRLVLVTFGRSWPPSPE